MHYQYMLVYKYGQILIGRPIASNFRGHYDKNPFENRKKENFFPDREMKWYPVRSNAHRLPLSHPSFVGAELKRIICIRNIFRAQKITESVKCECA